MGLKLDFDFGMLLASAGWTSNVLTPSPGIQKEKKMDVAISHN